MPTATNNPFSVLAKLVPTGSPVSAGQTLQAHGLLDAAGAEKVFLREFAGNVTGLVRQGTDLMVFGPNGEVLAVQNFYSGIEAKQLLLLDSQGGVVAMETAVATDGPLALYSTPSAETAPFESLTSNPNGSESSSSGGGTAAVVGGVMAAGLATGFSESPDEPSLPDAPAPQPPADTTPPATPSGLSFAADGSSLSGTTEAGASVTVRDAAGNIIGTATAGADGRFNVSLSPVQKNGETVTVTAADAASNTSSPATATAPDITPPAAADDLAVSPDGGTVTGKAEPGATVTVRDPAGEAIGSVVVGGDGSFTLPLVPPLTNGESVSVIVEDAAGNASPPASVVAPDTTAPAAPADLSVSADGLTLTGEGEPGASVIVRDADGEVVGEGQVGADGRFSLTLDPPQTSGGQLGVVLTDAAGNASLPGHATAPSAVRHPQDNDEVPGIAIPEADGGVTPDEAADDIQVIVTLTSGTEVGDIVSVEIVNVGTFDHVVTEADRLAGEVTVNLPGTLLSDVYSVVARISDGQGNTTRDTDPVELIVLEPIVGNPQEPHPQDNGEVPVVDVPEAAGGITPSEAADGIQVNVQLTSGTEEGDTVIISDASGELVRHVLTAAEIDAGSVTLTVVAGAAGNYTISAIITDGNGNTTAPSDPFDYTLLPPGVSTTVTLDAIAVDDVVNIAESQGGITITGRVNGEFEAGDSVTVTLGAAVISGTVGADGRFSLSVPGVLLTGGTLTVTVNATTVDGVIAFEGTRNYAADLEAPLTPTVTVPAAADGIVSDVELAAGLTAEVTLPANALPGETVILTLTVGGVGTVVQHEITAADIAAGVIEIALGTGLSDGQYAISARIVDPAGNSSAPTPPFAFEIDAIQLETGTSTTGVSEADISAVGTGTVVISGATGTAELVLSGPTEVFTSKGETIVWSLDGNGVLLGQAGGRTVVTASIAADGSYEVRLLDGIDHPAGSDSLVLPITVTATDDDGSATGAINVTVTDGEPTLSAPLTLTPSQPGVTVGTLVSSMGLDGGYLQSVEVDGLTFNSNAAGNITVSGSSDTVLSYAISGSVITLTTIRGETVQVDTRTGDYKVVVTGVGAPDDVPSNPSVGMATTGGLLGLIDANVLDIIRLDTQQFFTASDADNDIVSVHLSVRALVSIGAFNFNSALAAELGIVVTPTPWQALGVGVLWGDVGITLTPAPGSDTIDSWKLNEFLGSVTLGNGVLDVSALQGLSITATDSEGNTDAELNVSLANLGVGAGLLEALLPDVNQHGTSAGETLNGSDAATGNRLDNRLYGYGGDDTLNGNLGNDLLRGGAGNDILNGGDGNDILIGGTGVDTMTGGAGSDIFRFEKGDAFGIVSTDRDVIEDFSNASLSQGGDVLDLSSMLIGEGRIGKNAGNLANYLHFEATSEGTVIHISTVGAFQGGYGDNNRIATDHRILLKGVDLTAGFASDIEIINDLLARNKLLVDTLRSSDSSAHGDLQIIGHVVDFDGDGGSTSVVIDDDQLSNGAGNTPPMVGAAADNWLLAGGILGYDLDNQDLLVADADNNLARVAVNYTPLLAVNLSPLGFAYDESLANLYGYDVEVVTHGGLLGVIAPSARIEITSASGDPLDNEQINEFLATVRLVDLNGSLLSSSAISVNLLANMSLYAEDVWGQSSEAALSTFLNVNALNSIDKPLVSGSSGSFSHSALDDLVSVTFAADATDELDDAGAVDFDQWLESDDLVIPGMQGDALDAKGTAFEQGYTLSEDAGAFVPPLPQDDLQDQPVL